MIWMSEALRNLLKISGLEHLHELVSAGTPDIKNILSTKHHRTPIVAIQSLIGVFLSLWQP